MIVLAFFVVGGLGFLSIILSLLMFASIPFSRMSVRDFLIQRDALQATYTDLRNNPLEMATNLPTLVGLKPMEFVMKSDDREEAEKTVKRILSNTLSGDYA